MSTKRGRQPVDPATPDLKALAKEWSELKELSGSDSGYFTLALMNQVWRAQWQGENPAEWIVELSRTAATSALKGIAPRDSLEGMLAGQMVATHETAMDCFRRAQLPNQTFEGRRQNLEFANKLVRSYAVLVETLDKHRGKGQQVVRVEHVTVNAGGQAIVGAVSHPGGGEGLESEERVHARQLGHAPEPTLRGANPQRQPVPVAGGGRTRCRMHGGAAGSGGQPGNRNARKHGRYTAEAVALRQHVRGLLRAARELAQAVE